MIQKVYLIKIIFRHKSYINIPTIQWREYYDVQINICAIQAQFKYNIFSFFPFFSISFPLDLTQLVERWSPNHKVMSSNLTESAVCCIDRRIFDQ